jgi:hypothetical protein
MSIYQTCCMNLYPMLPDVQMQCYYCALDFHLSPLLEYLSINRVRRYEPVYGDMLALPISPQSSNGLRLACVIYLLALGKKGGKEDSMVGNRQVRTTGAFVHDVQQKYAFLTVVLELFQVLTFLGCRAVDFQELNLVHLQCMSDFRHEVRKLDKYENSVLLRDLVPEAEIMSIVAQTSHNHVLDEVHNHL